MKKGLKILLIVSLIINVFFVIVQIRIKQLTSYSFKAPEIKEVNIGEERTKFFAELTKTHPQLSGKKYFFINAWSPGDWESMHQMTILDTLIQPVKNNFAYIFVSDEKTDYAWRRLKEHSGKAKNFIYLNDQKDFMTSVYQEKKMLYYKGWRGRMTPMNMVINNKGKIIYFDTLRPLNGIIYNLESNTKSVKSLDSLEKALNKKYVRTIDSLFNSLN